MVVRVAVTEIFRNCPRYVHRYRTLEPSEFVPRGRAAKRRSRHGSASTTCRRCCRRRIASASGAKAA